MSFFKNWVKEIKKYLFTYKDGFFVFPIFTEDPEELIEGLKNTPMVKYDSEKQHVFTNTSFLKGNTYFRSLEDGLWIVYTSISFKKNICFEMVRDLQKTSNYYTLAIDTSKTAKDSIHYSKEGAYIENQSYYWRLIKPGTLATNYNLANTQSKIVSIYIHQDWFKRYFFELTNTDDELFDWFQKPERTTIFLPNSSMTTPTSLDLIINQFENQDQQNIGFLSLKSNVFSLLSAFMHELKEKSNYSAVLKPKDEAKVLKAEQLLKAAISDGFPTIHNLAKKVGVSETKLKSDFKSIYNKTLFQYFAEAQMDVAEKMLLEGHHSVKSVAYFLGYSNPGKFSMAFKKIKKVSPSSIKTSGSSAQ